MGDYSHRDFCDMVCMICSGFLWGRGRGDSFCRSSSVERGKFLSDSSCFLQCRHDSDPNDSQEASTSDSPNPASQESSTDKGTTRTSKRSARSSVDESKPVKAGTKQTKMEDFGTKVKSGDKDSVVNGSAKPVGRQGGKGGGQGEETSKAAGEQNKGQGRKRHASGEEAGAAPAAKRGKGSAAEAEGTRKAAAGTKRQQAAA